MYYKDRAEAGQKITERLAHYKNQECVAIALNDGATLVAEQIAKELNCPLTMLITEQIDVPGEQQAFGTVDQGGTFVYNHSFSQGEFEEYYTEFHGYLEDKKRETFQHINRLLGDGGILDPEILQGRVIILVSDGMANGNLLDAAAEFLKPVRVGRLVAVVPVAAVAAVDRMHIIADELVVLSVASNFFDTNHYYDDNTIPSHDEIIRKISSALRDRQLKAVKP